MKQKIVEKYICLRALVGFLGEKPQFNWWDTNFLSSIGLQYLAINFTRSALVAGITSVTEAARCFHDSRIGKGGVYHLFRLPFTMEVDIHNILMKYDGSTLIAELKDTETALSRLKYFIDSTVDAPEGPIQIGTERQIQREFAVSELAKHYLDAFANGKQVLPYFSVV